MFPVARGRLGDKDLSPKWAGRTGVLEAPKDGAGAEAPDGGGRHWGWVGEGLEQRHVC